MRRFAIGLLGLGLVIGLVALMRVRFVERFVQGELASRGVAGSFTIDRAGTGGVHGRDVALGPKGRPDFRARAIDATIGWVGLRPTVTAVRLDGAVLRASLDREGRLHLGALDRLLPRAQPGAPVLPTMAVDIRNSRLLLVTPYGEASAEIRAEGRVANGLRGELALAAPRVGTGGCVLERLAGPLRLTSRAGVLRVMGRLTAAGGACAGAAVGPTVLALNARADTDFAALDGSAELSARDISMDAAGAGLRASVNNDGRAAQLNARFVGRAGRTGAEGHLCLAASGLASGGWSAATVAAGGQLAARAGRTSFDGPVHASGVRPERVLIDGLAQSTDALAATPLGPIERALRAELAAAGPFDARANVQLTRELPGIGVTASALRIAKQVGRAAATDPRRIELTAAGPLRWSSGHGLTGSGTLTLRTPTIGLARFTPARAGAAGDGALQLGRVTAPGAAIEPTTLDVRWARDAVRIVGPLTMTGPLGPGRVETLTLPRADLGVALARPAISVARCTPVHAARVIQPSFTFTTAALNLCPAVGPVLGLSAGRLTGAATLRDIRLGGRAGEQPFRATASALPLRIGGTVAATEVTLGPAPVSLWAGERRLDLASADATARSTAAGWRIDGSASGGTSSLGTADASAIAGRFALSPEGAFSLTGLSAIVRDAAPRPAFAPIRASGGELSISDGAARFRANLAHAPTATPLGTVEGRYDLAIGRAAIEAALAVSFSPDFQPFQLSERARGQLEDATGKVRVTAALTYAEGKLSGPGRITIPALDFATAALGPVKGVRADIALTDLPELVSAPGQMVHIGSINPGLALGPIEGRVTLLGQGRTQIESLTAPFSGGTLSLRPALIDPAAADRLYTLDVTGLDAASFVQLIDLKDLDATGLFDGAIPLRLSQAGTRIAGGQLVARAPGGRLRYAGKFGPGLPQGARLAFDALRSMRYRTLTLGLNGELDGEIVTSLTFTGTNEAAVNAGGAAKLPPGVPFRFGVTITAPFRRLLGTAAGFSDARPLILQGSAPAPDPLTPRSPPPGH
ncbi:MAG: YdbH domain-containing protein [Sphingomonadaceae bacterium]|nr:YdbH domain-containing protein [Sphingomonadaceae bacterium]